jgi:DNA-3-methyladenine glycosylase II
MDHDAARAAYTFLAALDDPIARLANEHGPVDFRLPSVDRDPLDHLGQLTLGIVGQVISVKAAAVIFTRLAALLGGTVDAAGLARADEAELRAIGLTQAKARAVHELGIELVSGSFSFEQLESMSDGEAQARLSALRGVGPWSAQLFLLRAMGRPDVFPAGDLGLRRAIELIDSLPRMPTIPEAAKRALAWRPYRSFAAKYLWLHYASGAAVPREQTGNPELREPPGERRATRTNRERRAGDLRLPR